jgi:hypothetical protein
MLLPVKTCGWKTLCINRVCINCTIINISILYKGYRIISIYRKLIKYCTAIRSKMICNNKKTITEMTAVNSKLTITNLDHKLIKTLS